MNTAKIRNQKKRTKRGRADIEKARAKIQETKHKKLDKIMSKLAEKDKITNDELVRKNLI